MIDLLSVYYQGIFSNDKCHVIYLGLECSNPSRHTTIYIYINVSQLFGEHFNQIYIAKKYTYVVEFQMSEWYIIVFLMNNREKLYNITQGIVVQWFVCSFREQKTLDTFGGQARYFRIRLNFSLTRNAINTFCNKPILVDLITSE